jgi:hypothetical protein
MSVGTDNHSPGKYLADVEIRKGGDGNVVVMGAALGGAGAQLVRLVSNEARLQFSRLPASLS